MLKSSTNMQAPQPYQEVLSILNGRKTATRTKGITKSFRLDEDILKKLNEQTKNNNTSLNAEINSILRKYVDWDMLASKVGMIPVARPILSEIFQNIMTKEQVIDLANNVAKNVIHEMVLFMKGNLTLELFLSWLIARMEHCSEVNYSIENTVTKPQIKIRFKHELGENWSVYNKIIIEHIIHEILKKYEVGIAMSSTTISLCFI
jgi:DNA-directed RNA polymerase subunit L